MFRIVDECYEPPSDTSHPFQPVVKKSQNFSCVLTCPHLGHGAVSVPAFSV